MGSLWNFFGLPDPEGTTPAAANTPPPEPAAPKPVSLTGTQTEEGTLQAVEPVAVTAARLEPDISGLRTPPLGWNGPLTPCLLYTSPSPRDATLSRMPSSA